MDYENENQNTGAEPRGADFADPALWRLTVYLGAGCVKAYLRNTADASAPLRELASAAWQAPVEETLRRIENAVYDNPAVLDDYSADIIIESDRALWMPKEYAGDEEEAAGLYRKVFPEADEDDVFSDFEGDKVCVYHLVNGLAAFIRRTFPGARVCSRQSVLYRRFRLRPAESFSVYVDLRGKKADILILRNSALLHSSTHPARSMREAQYHIVNCMDVSGVDRETTEVLVSGDRTLRHELIAALREGLPMVRNTTLPRVSGPEGMPTPVILCTATNRPVI